MGSFIEMQDVGPVLLNDNRSCSTTRFLEIGNDLGTLHKQGKTHGDIRLSNLILGGERGRIVDWDLAGTTGEKTYPAGLKTITDGSRHIDVTNAIRKKRIAYLPLENEHDWESLRAVMRCFAPQEASHTDAWNNFIDDINDGTKRDAVQSHFVVELKSDVGEFKATGSPPSPA